MASVLIFFSIIFGVCCVLAEKNEFTSITELSPSNSKEDHLQTNIIHTNSSEPILNKSDAEETKKTEKKPRTAIHRDSNFESRDNSSCCDSRYGLRGSARPDYNYNKIPVETGRYPLQYGERQPIDRHGWQTQNRPAGIAGSNRPGGSYSGSGTYAGNQLGDRYGPRPSVYGSETANRPNTVGYGPGNIGGYGISGSYGRPTGYGGSNGNGGYGISGTLADGDEFGPGEPASGYPDVNMSMHPGNIHTQKAVALKALAGVALIGAAAALASNPVLLPIGIVAGRRKRSENFSEEEQTDFETNYILNMIKDNLAKIQKQTSSNKLLISPRCVARLTCEIQKNYLSDIERDTETLNESKSQKYHLIDLIQNKVFNTTPISANVKNLIKVAIGTATENESCAVFPCNYIKKG